MAGNTSSTEDEGGFVAHTCFLIYHLNTQFIDDIGDNQITLPISLSAPHCVSLLHDFLWLCLQASSLELGLGGSLRGSQ